MKIVKILGIGAFTAMLVVLCVFGLDYVLSDDSESYSRITLHELYGQENVDSIFLGPSHVYSGLDPAITDEAWGENTFNSSTPSQRINTSYALLKEAYRTADIDTCYLEISIRGVKRGLRQREMVPEVYNVSDYMKWSWNKVSYLLNAVQPEDYIHAFCRARRNWKSIYSLSTMKETVSKKSQDDYQNYVPVEKKTSYYAGKGFVYYSKEFNNADTSTRKPYEGPITEEFQCYFQKIVQYCQENEIELVCFSVPFTEYTMESIGNYDEYYLQAKELCEKYGVSYYDFNLANPSILDIQDSDFRDAHHLNGAGAEKFTKVFADFFAGKIEKEELFYGSYAEKREHLPKRFIGVILKRTKSKEICKIRPITTKEDDYEYEVYYQDENGEYILLQEKSPNLKIELPTKKKVKLKVRVYDSESSKVDEFNQSV